MKKLIGDVFEDKCDYLNFIIDTTCDHIVYPKKVKYYICDDMGEYTKNKLLKENMPLDIVEGTIASFAPINDEGLREIREGVDTPFEKDNISILTIYTNRLEKEINYAINQKFNALDLIKITLIHECRHAQQFFYIMDLFNDHHVYEDLVTKDYIMSNYNPCGSILESDAEVYAYNQVLKRNKKSIAGTLKMNKVMSYLFTKIANTNWR